MTEIKNKHSAYDLAQMQGLPLEAKIRMTKERIRSWYDHWDGQVYVSFSGGKDSTVLLHLVRSLYPDVEAVFSDTGLEYPEIRNFAMSQENVTVVRPEKNFRKVIFEEGYPIISKQNALFIRQAKELPVGSKSYNLRMYGIRSDGVKIKVGEIPKKWKPLVDAPFKISEKCCDIMKKKPIHEYEKINNKKPYTGQMACESNLRERQWMKFGCNAFDNKTSPKSNPMSFWTENDVLEYIRRFNIPYCNEIYGDIVETGNMIERITGEVPELKTTGVDRTGCMFCMFGSQHTSHRFSHFRAVHTEPSGVPNLR